ncbi:MAG: PaaI family thioesterase [Novosphingopyxis baekryungensis]|jgi:acyl-coenzyme A thioesterase PaaI-like protein|uniref:PaaI family thioesterase n=1 Tax=Novosphingopyxis baekryungensis TaxID=279369 RepID=UPI0003B79B32|nr:PaaI family thioesterase [Novosphingopyxis baekryungensis]MDE0933972.1 PaaI family thioesterase [Novosphingopyxis baekryungensis]
MPMIEEQHPWFDHAPDPANPGWMTWNAKDSSRYNGFLGSIAIREDAAPGCGWVRMMPGHQHSNFGENVHGGTILGFIDVCLFAGSRAIGIDLGGRAVTVELSTQFVGAAIVGRALDCKLESVRETGKMLFLRGLLMQRPRDDADYANVASFNGILRKGLPRP